MSRSALLLLVLPLSLPISSRLGAQISPGPLARAHQSLEGATNCASCHGVRREPMTQLCLNCHKEIRWLTERGRGVHGREVRQTKKDCASCHPDHAGAAFQMIAWDGGAASKFDHDKAGWPLDGKHTAEKCEGCHTGKYRVSQSAQLSPRKNGAGWVGLETTCNSCHRDDDVHNGKLDVRCETCHTTETWEDAPKFDHAKSDYPLTGKHVDVECSACHLVKKLALRTDAKGEPIPVFKPVPFKDCSACHSDPHKGQLTGECSGCHVTRGFGIIDKREFNHAATRYPLRGKHAAVNCEACHAKNLTIKDPPYTTCGACHSDPHAGEGKIGGNPQDCASCHRVEGFLPSTFTVAKHRETAYALEGKHMGVKCSACHSPVQVTTKAGKAVRAGRIRMAYSRCTDCHADAHAGQLAARTDAGACESCHAVSGFVPSIFTTTQHASLKLPLEGRHAAVPCSACHGAKRSGLPAHAKTRSLGTASVAVTLDATCTSCHVDAHAGVFEKTANLAGCVSCHSATAFHPSSVDIARHDAFTFKLEGAHRAVPCGQCHRAMTSTHASSTLLLSARNVPKLPFGEQRSMCAACHETPHGKQFTARADRGDCAACHGVEEFAPASRFDHNRHSTFKLEGAHAKTACGACHTQSRDVSGSTVTIYRGVSTKCESCHGGRIPGNPA
ncbi:MAG: cytochrome c3 family protein [Gemmatimonadota bacterium]